MLNTSIILMGVSGSGKSTIGSLLSDATGADFFDGDDFHPKENIEKMSNGIPLNDDDRKDWLVSLRDLLDLHSPSSIIIACSALKDSYRDFLETSTQPVRFIYLKGSKALLTERLAQRASKTNHFMPTSLLDSQLDTLQEPQGPQTVTISIDQSPKQIIETLLSSL